ncbi:DUF1120 domain-containing protein [Burkholderia ambifaria]|uniref:DUF1120 domain-containing protein n=1 Tax=Burkholderia ambifaria TaxID=152480 RepID=UPI0015928F28|nr:DUF1120 domain-containing protein [Burkholderia ambifaria]
MKMNTHALALSAVSFMLFAVAAHAEAPTAELRVTGKIDVPGCTLSVPDDGTYDFGRISPSIIKSSGTTQLTPITKSWTAQCDASTYLSFKVTDNRKDTVSVANYYSFGLGSVNGNGKLGYYGIKMENGQVDGKKTQVYATVSSAVVGASSISVFNNSGYRHGWANGSIPAIGKDFTVDLTVTPTLADTKTMGGALTDSVNLDGSATLTFAFGI